MDREHERRQNNHREGIFSSKQNKKCAQWKSRDLGSTYVSPLTEKTHLKQTQEVLQPS